MASLSTNRGADGRFFQSGARPCRRDLPPAGAQAVAQRHRRGARGPSHRGDRLFDPVAARTGPRRHCPHARPRVRHAQCQGGGPADQFSRRIGGAIAPDIPADSRARGREEPARLRRRGGRGGVRRLHDRLRRRRDRLRPRLDRGLDRRRSARASALPRRSGSSGSSGASTRPATTSRCSTPSSPKRRRTWPG